MAVIAGTKGSFTLKAYVGDFKTLLAFNFSAQPAALAGFTIQCQPPGSAAFYLFNELQFQDPTDHAQIATEPANSTVNAPIQKYRWVHVPGSSHQGTQPVTGKYTYTVTPRHFDANARMLPLDTTQSASVTVAVGPFVKGSLALGFTRGYMQSEAFVHNFTKSALLEPKGKPLQFDTTQQAGTDPTGNAFTFADEYAWLGWTARVQIFALLDAVVKDSTLTLDVFAYDFNEPDVVSAMLTLAKQGRVRMILDNASLHMGSTPETAFAGLFTAQAKAPAELVRGCFDRYSHDKIFIVKKNGAAVKVLTGSTNFSITGLYVNANHVLVFDDATVAGYYEQVFEGSWGILKGTKTPSATASNAFAATSFATKPFAPSGVGLPKMSVTFSPHTTSDVTTILGGIADRINAEAATEGGSVMFAVMQLTGSNTPVYNALDAIHGKTTLFSYGISDAPSGTYLYAPGSATGVLVTGKPGSVTLPPPFDQLPSPPGHEIHDKFVVCGLNCKDPVVYCGSSNLATGGENQNGDNLLQIHDADVATAFAIEALLLVDHYDFLDKYRVAKTKSGVTTVSTDAASPGAAKAKSATKKVVAKKTATAKSAPKKSAVKKSAAKKAATKKAVAKKGSR
ncbi:PLD-like domain-containing protein [Bryocella elongata]|uniref:phospholipase D n=1 Tax=Bryocella elongata TaxID=863522 RepID=A0A1H6B2Y6_9BACT|nr:phospholipase D-like domain-containing protein [Bryocella elongata]SEG55208.1 PLD-like domain-containing protein [Bryocella elongata]